jgi:hypothetical protein
MQQKPEPGDEPLEGGFWLSWRRAVEQVERSRGVSWDEAAKAVDDAIANGKLTCRPILGDRPDVLDVDLWRWLASDQPKPRASEADPSGPCSQGAMA